MMCLQLMLLKTKSLCVVGSLLVQNKLFCIYNTKPYPNRLDHLPQFVYNLHQHINYSLTLILRRCMEANLHLEEGVVEVLGLVVLGLVVLVVMVGLGLSLAAAD